MQRNNVIDIAKGIAIILMVVGHCDDLPEVVRYFIYSFHMPLFFIFSGYFFRKRGGMDCVKNSARGLLKPYLIVSIVGVLLATLLYGAEGFKEQLLGCILANGGAAFFGERMPTTGPMWFLVALFWCRLFYDYLVSKTHRPLLWSFVISTVAFAIGYFITNLPFGILYGCASLVFYSMGHYWRKAEPIHLTKQLWIWGIIIWAFCVWKSHLEIAMLYCKHFPITMIGALFGTYCVYLLAERIDQCSNRLKKILLWYGNNSLLVLCYHTIFMGLSTHHLCYNITDRLNLPLQPIEIWSLMVGLSLVAPCLHRWVETFLKKA